ncbi:MAG: GGDEF domain-containing protein [Patescibacteria group bacterium]
MSPLDNTTPATSASRRTPASSRAAKVRRTLTETADKTHTVAHETPSSLASMGQVELIQEVMRLRVQLELERQNRDSLEQAMSTEWCIEDVLYDIDHIDSIADLFHYVLEKLPAKLGKGTRLHFVDMAECLAVESEAYRRNPQVTDLGEIFRNALSAYLLSRFDNGTSGERETDRHFHVHLDGLQNKRNDREYYPITIENSVIGGTQGRTVDVTIGYVELLPPKPGTERSIAPQEQIRKVMRAMKARLERVQSMLLIEERTRLACEDPLTGVANRRGFFESVSALRKKHPGSNYSTINIDLDHFKSVNDNHGHETGDVVLKHVASKLRETLSWRKDLVVSRFGGEEFVIYCQSPGEHETVAIAERLRKIIAAEPVITQKGEIAITTSIGVTECRSPAERIEEVIDRADALLYRAKTGGRNRVEYGAADEFVPVPESKKAVAAVQKGVDSNRRSNWVKALQEMFSPSANG